MPHDDVSLKEHLLALRESDARRIDQAFVAQERAVTAAFEAAREATQKAEVANEKRLDSVNEFRSTLKDQQGTFVTRGEFYAFIGVAGVVGGFVGHLLK